MSDEFNPSYVFRETDPACFQMWPDDVTTEFLCNRCAKTMWEREFPVYADEMPERWDCDRCGKPILKTRPLRLFWFRVKLFRAWNNGWLKSIWKARKGGKQYLSPQRW